MLQQFLGFSKFHWRFIWSFSTLVRPLIDLLLGQATHLKWTPVADIIFEDLKTVFTNTPVLQQPNPTKPIIVEIDTSYPNPTEYHYGVGDQELAMKISFGEWKYWLDGVQHPFTVITSDKNLEHLQKAKRLNSRQAQWSVFFSQMVFQIS
ncbi:hypothetical protein P4O66_020398 [Electrophorus voltai]|uniref:Reverse transcriptase RNase H-like domain-containing protein n=1 Tax=Electrophorus voltai TaxID=2609070 RepID=A0AAD8ZRZ0_9TELE|nr:hypothetical protein P4O66_020398 [Electrophorus voltai]